LAAAALGVSAGLQPLAIQALTKAKTVLEIRG
jgi:hypothetical protein